MAVVLLKVKCVETLGRSTEGCLSIDTHEETQQFLCCRYVLKNLVRDWAAEGAAEREESYGRILERLFTYFKVIPPG